MKIEQTIKYSLHNLFECAEKNNDKANIDTAVGEVNIEGVKYQIQLSLIADEKLWIKGERDVRFSEVVKVH